MLHHLFQFLLPYETQSYYIIFLILFFCGLGLPIPEDITLVVSGILIASKVIHFWPGLILCMAGIIVGDGMVYTLGRIWGVKLLKTKYISRFYSDKTQEKMTHSFQKHGNKILFFARFMPGLRAPMYFYCGLMKKSFLTFISVDFFAALISVPIWVYVGMVFGNNLSKLEKIIKEIQTGIYIILAFAILIFFFSEKIKKFFSKSLDV